MSAERKKLIKELDTAFRHGMKEQQIQKQIIDYLTAKGWYVWKNKNTNRGTGIYLPTHQRGIADLTAIKNGFVAFLEIKKVGGKISKEQREFEYQIDSHGGYYFILKSVEDAKEFDGMYGNRQ
jgi:hypothetical protein